MAQSILQAKLREKTGKQEAKKVRKDGNIPAVFYGKDTEPILLSINPSELKTALNTDTGINTLLELQIDGVDKLKNNLSLIKDYQIDPITSQTLHIDFQSIDLKKKIEVTVPLNIYGRSKGEMEGGVQELYLREIELLCLPSNIPNSIDVDVAELELNSTIYVKDLKLEEDIQALRNEDEIVLSIITPKAIIEEETDIEEEEVEKEEDEQEDGDQEE